MIMLSIVVLFLFLAGCVTNVKTHAVRGGSGIEIDCSGLGGAGTSVTSVLSLSVGLVDTRSSPSPATLGMRRGITPLVGIRRVI